ncbi:MAG: riboflavin synthase [Syntrophales bacterium]|nr:riboflavin synthase [Syntrophales bacterium]
MFTGIIQNLGKVKQLSKQGEGARIVIKTNLNLEDLKIGDSIAVDGVCLTITRVSVNEFTADVSAETLNRTTLGNLKLESLVNLEKPLRPTDFLGGHFVLGHVDGIGYIKIKETKVSSTVIAIETKNELMRYIVEKGSIAVDGVSLTVNRVLDNCFYVNIIPHTASVTTLTMKKIGDQVNIETDIIGKYIEKFVSLKEKTKEERITLEFLQKHGFVR